MSPFTIRPAGTEAEFLEAVRLTTQVFRGDDPAAMATAEAQARRLWTYPAFDYAWHRLGWHDDQVVTSVVVWPLKLRYGRVEIPFGGIGGVCTHPHYRRRGYALQVMHEARQYMLARGDLLALLWTGLDGFYTPLGYHNVWPNHGLEFSAAAAAQLEAPLPMRPATPDDTAQLAALYEQAWGHRVAAIRPLDVWQWRMNTAPPDYLQVVEADGRMVGYIAADDSTGLNGEVVVSTLAAAQTIMAVMGRAAHAAGHEHVSWGISPDDRLIFDARKLRLNPLIRTYHASRLAWMGTIIDPSAFRDTLLPEILAVSGLDADAFELDIQPEFARIQKDGVSLQFDHSDFLPLLFGSIPPSALADESDAVDLLSTLFPPRISQIATWDWF